MLSRHSTLHGGPSALHSGHSIADQILDTNQQVYAMLHSGGSSMHPALQSGPLQQHNIGMHSALHLGPLQQHSTAQRQQLDLHTGDSSIHPMLKSVQQTQQPSVTAQQKMSAAEQTNDSRAQAVLSSSTPDKFEEPRVLHQSSPSYGSQQDRAEQGSAFGPAPTGPPSTTVSRSGRIVHRAAKVCMALLIS